MGRTNTIVVAGVVLAPLILGIEGYIVFRSHPRGRPATAIDEPPRALLPAGPAAAAPAPPPAAVPPAVPAQAPDPPAPAAPAEPAAQDPALARRRRALLEHRGQLVRDADEQVFEALDLPADTRAAIRTIDDQYLRALAAMRDTPEGSDFLAAGTDLNADQTRLAAITSLLGADRMPAFNVAERKAEHRVHNQLRPESVRGR